MILILLLTTPTFLSPTLGSHHLIRSHSLNLTNKDLINVKPAALKNNLDDLKLADDLSPTTRSKIFNGEEASHNTAPWQILLLVGNGICGGVVYSPSWIITAGHCTVWDYRTLSLHSFVVWAGELDRNEVSGKEQYRYVDVVIPHTDYDDMTISSDIALLHLTKPLHFDEHVQSIEIGSELPEPGDTIRTTGFGVDNSGDVSRDMLFIDQEVPGQAFCYNTYKTLVDHTMWCAGTLEMTYRTMPGDSGGPVVQVVDDTPYLVGLVSWSSSEGAINYFDVNTHVPYFKSWVEDMTNSTAHTEVLQANHTSQSYNWSSASRYKTHVIKIKCNHDKYCRIAVRPMKMTFGNKGLTRVNFYNSLRMEEYPSVTLDVENYDSEISYSGVISEGNKMMISILKGEDRDNFTLSFTYYNYNYSLCADEDKKCDKINDCLDLTDEIGCDYGNVTPAKQSDMAAGCYAGDYVCLDTGMCIRSNKVCDGYYDCNSRQDEANCSGFTVVTQSLTLICVALLYTCVDFDNVIFIFRDLVDIDV